MLHALTQEEINQIPANVSDCRDIPQAIQNKLLKCYFKSELRLVFGNGQMSSEDLDLAIDDFLQRDSINPWMNQTSGITSKEEFFAERGINPILLATSVIAKSMHQRLRTPDDWDQIKGANAEALQKKIEGVLDKRSVIAALNFLHQDEPSKNFLIQWINAATLKEVENFVFCISNSRTLVLGRGLDIAITAPSANLPAFHTCHFRMDLPRYENYEVFQGKLNLSIQYVLGGNIVGLV
jgi:hypothetical protein